MKVYTICTHCNTSEARRSLSGRKSSTVYYCDTCKNTFDQMDYLIRADYFIEHDRDDQAQVMLDQYDLLVEKLFATTGKRLYEEEADDGMA